MIATPCWATGNGPPVGAYKQALEGFPTDAGFVLMSGPRSDLPNARGAIVGGTNIAVTDGGAGGNVTVAVNGQIAITNGGTGASTREAALDALMSFAGLASQDLAYYDGTHWVRLAKGSNDTYLKTNGSGNLAWTGGTVGPYISDAAQVILMASHASATAGRVATQGSGITITDGATIATFAVDNTVIRTTGSQSMADKTLTNPSMAWSAGGGIALQASTFNSALKWADWAAARNLTIPDPGADANFVLSEGNATVNGEKTFSDLKLSGTTFKTAANTITVPAATDTLVNLSSTQVLTNKELTAPLVSGTIGYKAGSFQHNIAAAAPSADRAVTLPDPGTDSKFALTSTTITHANGGVIYSNGATMACSAAGTSGKALISAGAAAPSFGTLGADGGGTGNTSYTKGDLLVTPGSTTLNKLGVGTDGQVLTADAASTNGVKWATAGGGSPTLSLTGLSFMTSGAGTLTGSATAGDIAYGSASNTWSKLGIGSTGQVLTVASGLPSWATPAATSFTYSSKTASFTAVSNNAYGVDTTSAAVTCTLPTAVGIAGQEVVISLRNVTNNLTFATTSAQTIDGQASGAIVTGVRYNTYRFMSDGANWILQ